MKRYTKNLESIIANSKEERRERMYERTEYTRIIYYNRFEVVKIFLRKNSIKKYMNE